jgi:tetraacyldisaccharide 4'-kinase
MTSLQPLVQRWWRGELRAAGRVLDVLLAPAELLYRLAVRGRAAGYDAGVLRVRRAAVPVISVGNVAVGGTGKTPVARWLADQLRRAGRRPALLHGGYGADEPALHRRWAPATPVLSGRDRVATAAAAVAGGADVLVLDDAFQHRRLHRDLDIVLVAAEQAGRSERLLPRGPWREPALALRRADLIVVTRKTAPAQAARQLAGELGARAACPVAVVHLRASGWQRAGTASPPPAGAALAVAAIAEPALFADSARLAGATVADVLVFPDHHRYTAADAARIRAAAGDRPVVTTEKDWIKLDRLLNPDHVWVLVQEVLVEYGRAAVDAALARVLR